MSNKDKQTGFTIVELLIVIVVIGILAAIVIVAYNGVSQRAHQASMESTIGQWKRKAELYKAENNIVCPKNYVFVYGNPDFGTTDFCVMKYEAKNVGGIATSQASGTFWTFISQNSALSVASSACDGCYLMTDAQWMTIAAEVLSIDYNWTGRATGKVGQGFVYSGHSDGVPNSPLEASEDDNDGYFGTGNSYSSGANQLRTFYLKSGDVIWDMSGNLWEFNADTIAQTPGATISTWDEYPGFTNWGNVSSGSRPASLSTINGLGDIENWGSDLGIGRIVTGWNNQQVDPGVRAFHRGGRWSNGPGAGVLTLALDAGPNNSFSFSTFRAAR